MAAQIIACSGEIIDLELEGKVSLKLAQGIVGGLVELVPANIGEETIQILVNEEGLIKGLPRNNVATGLCDRPIVGVALYLSGKHKWD